MFEKVSHAAEQVARSASRREFLGKFGRGAMAAVAALSGVLALPAISAAARKPPAACGGHSYISCVGRNTGDPCISALGRSGVCRFDKIDFTPADACECYVKGPKNSRRV
jgi:hypothetical protein